MDALKDRTYTGPMVFRMQAAWAVYHALMRDAWKENPDAVPIYDPECEYQMKTTAGTSEWYSEHLNWSTSTIGKNALRGRKMLSLMQVVGQIRIHRIVKEVMFSEIIRDPEKLNVRGLPDSPVYEDVKEAEGEMMRARPDWPDGISVGHSRSDPLSERLFHIACSPFVVASVSGTLTSHTRGRGECASMP